MNLSLNETQQREVLVRVITVREAIEDGAYDYAADLVKELENDWEQLIVNQRGAASRHGG